ncbi:unnamed protein product [Rotaria sp. Silwood1]|nr:unnamed protein product [Rotaria sp. Silwood1]
MLSNARKYIPPCQSRFCHQPIKEIANTEYETVLSSVQQCLKRNEMSITDQRAKQSFADLERIMHDLYCKRLPQLTSDYCPLTDILHATTSVLDYLIKKKVITTAQRDKLLPNLEKLELPYLYPLPKIHKVKLYLENSFLLTILT